MNAQKFVAEMKKKRYYEKGEIKHYSDNAIESRLNLLKNLENIFQVNLDDMVETFSAAKGFLIAIRNKHIEDLAHTPYSNAFRHYYESMTGLCIGKIF